MHQLSQLENNVTPAGNNLRHNKCRDLTEGLLLFNSSSTMFKYALEM